MFLVENVDLCPVYLGENENRKVQGQVRDHKVQAEQVREVEGHEVVDTFSKSEMLGKLPNQHLLDVLTFCHT